MTFTSREWQAPRMLGFFGLNNTTHLRHERCEKSKNRMWVLK